MKIWHRAAFYIWPAILFGISIGTYVFHDAVLQYFSPDANREAISKLSAATAYFSGAWLLSRMIGSALRRTSNGRRQAPRLLRELITAALFLVATVATIAMLLGQSAGGALASSGLIIAILGFAIRNVLADVLSGIALGLEAPFRIGDWVEIDGVIRGRVIEIGWRTTRLQTRNETYMILPNSEISRQKITNYSAPKRHYRASLEIVIGHGISLLQAKELLSAAVMTAELIMKSPKPDVRALSYDAEGIRFAIRYWVPNFLDEFDCRDMVLVAIDEAIRSHGLPPPYKQLKLVSEDADQT